jgi:hypothetical protein
MSNHSLSPALPSLPLFPTRLHVFDNHDDPSQSSAESKHDLSPALRAEEDASDQECEESLCCNLGGGKVSEDLLRKLDGPVQPGHDSCDGRT